MSRHPVPLPEFGPRFWGLFWPLVGEPSGPLGCRLWLGVINENGYGQLAYEGKTYLAHRIARFLITGENVHGPEGHICHTCDTRACCEPRHLFVGSIQSNTYDRCRKSRSACGERQHLAALTGPEVVEIRRLRAAGMPLLDLVRRFPQVTKSTIARAAARKTWKHIP